MNESTELTIYAFDGDWHAVSREVTDEVLVSIHVNGQDLATVAATPQHLDWLAAGFLANAGLIASRDQVRGIHVCPSNTCVDVWLKNDIEAPSRHVVTSGCGGGIAFGDIAETREPLPNTGGGLSPEALWDMMRELQARGELYRRTRGIHASGLFQNGAVTSFAEDIGRHNTIDKIRGDCLLRGVDTRDGALVSTGRISSEMLGKAACMGCPVVASRTSPTRLSIQLAEAWNVTLAGYVRQGKMLVYSHGWRVGLPEK